MLSDLFLQIYNQLDDHMRKRLEADNNISHRNMIDQLSSVDRVFYINRYKLIQYSRLRNAIVHNPYSHIAKAIAEPHESVVKEYQRIKDMVIYPPKALNIAVAGSKVFKANTDDNALDVMKAMNINCYTHVPIMENGRFIGVFSENTVFSYIADNEGVILGKDECIREFQNYLPIDKHDSESFIFVPKDKNVCEIEEFFQQYFVQAKRLAAIFVTEKGNSNEDLLGMITAWDIAGISS